ncbi:MAG: cell division protein SepF [Oscillospiraceae bacterium]|nr:cell division protein SepF [Oscillospiraceae bacterium]MBQ8732435.1 cell division protein SepF [Oscillospiraceae bacterium]
MGFMNKIREVLGAEETDPVENENGYDQEELPFRKKAFDEEASYAEDTGGRKNRVVNIHATTQLQVILVKPERFEDASSIADHLNSKRTVVLNLESTNKDVSRRLVDFLSGVAYANNGQIKRVAASTFIITPYNVDLQGDLLDELESSGVYF